MHLVQIQWSLIYKLSGCLDKRHRHKLGIKDIHLIHRLFMRAKLLEPTKMHLVNTQQMLTNPLL